MTLRKYDLNLLTILDALLRNRSVTLAGQELGLTQSATSHALIRLREQFDDKLLIPSGRSMTLSHRAEALVGPVAELLRMAGRILDADDFDPATAIRRFRIGMGDAVAFLVLANLAERLQTNAPSLTVQATWTGRDIASKLVLGDIDIALVPEFASTDPVYSKRLFTDEFVVIAARNRDDIGDTIDAGNFERQRYVTFRNDAFGSTSFVDLQLAKLHINPFNFLFVPNFLLLPFVVSSTKCVALVHKRIADRMREWLPIRIIRPSFDLQPVHVSAYWSNKADTNAGHCWFREQLYAICERI